MNIRNLKVEAFEGEGLKRVVESGDWFVGIKNWKPANDAAQFDMMERHMLTDEVFVLLAGHCTLLVAEAEDGSCNNIHCAAMQPNQVYCIPKGIWHNTITTPDVKLILMENRNTSNDNSEMLTLSPEVIKAIRSDLGPEHQASLR